MRLPIPRPKTGGPGCPPKMNWAETLRRQPRISIREATKPLRYLGILPLRAETPLG